MKLHPAFLLVLGLVACGSLSPKPASWTPELVSATQQNFKLVGEWNFTGRTGGDFGKTCDLLFSADGSYRKSCPPLEEGGVWLEVGHWTDRTMRVRLRERVDFGRQEDLDPITIDIVVEAPDNNTMSFDGDLYKRR